MSLTSVRTQTMLSISRSQFTWIFSALCALALSPLHAQAQSSNPDADNTRMNQADRANTLTPLDQSNSQGDLRIAAAIRSALTDDKALSMNAQNIKVIVQQGNVTLRGPVANAAEKSRVESLAKGVAGVTGVRSEIDTKQ